ncbi:PQQ-dependent sugar dehydrogenase [Motilimonas pumila]|uniref:PQQ-dependent sugar dehydrogenase n=1 Tax=Motilimonas pumila TaxID=2303987 RepID=A0A418YER3_9GAMM|nr:PQQ-dependent sugar dehydrogenase [Motilimonas pumila]RJG47687.1 PQQ-dependent sugar dehydrogenase [Motilimonas pumila]
MITIKNLIRTVILTLFLHTPLAHAWQAEQVATGLGIPWGIAYWDPTSLLITTRSGEIIHLDVRSGEHTTLFKVPDVWHQGQGGLLDIAVSPFAANTLYFTYSKHVDGKGVTTLAKAHYKDNQLSQWQDVFVTRSASDSGRHFGSRIAFDQHNIYVSVGDRGVRENGQNTQNHAGTIIRVTPNGKVPKDNPYLEDATVLDEIWSYGHRNPQGLYFDAIKSQLWAIEHGPRGGDEINLIKPGGNYGWPVTSHGKEYWGPLAVGEAEHKAGIISPVKVYVPSIAPSGLVMYQGDKFASLKGKLLTGALKLQHINVISLDGNNQASEEVRLFENLNERVRDIEVTPLGEIFFSTDSGNIYRLAKQ